MGNMKKYKMNLINVDAHWSLKVLQRETEQKYDLEEAIENKSFVCGGSRQPLLQEEIGNEDYWNEWTYF